MFKPLTYGYAFAQAETFWFFVSCFRRSSSKTEETLTPWLLRYGRQLSDVLFYNHGQNIWGKL